MLNSKFEINFIKGTMVTPQHLNLSIILPVYNEEATIAHTIDSIRQNIHKYADHFEIVAVNDGAKDRSDKILVQIAATCPELKIVRHDTNKGYGEAVRTGFDHATMDWMLLMDSDGQFDLNELEKFLPNTSFFDVIHGIRAHRADPWHRTIGTKGYMVLMKLLFGLRISDVGCGFKLFRRSTWQQITSQIEARDHKIFLVEMILRAQRVGARITELPVQHLPRQAGQATGARADVIKQTFQQMFRLWRSLRAKAS
jgi:glycosyltransferase involved in cell wall biosynthesis